MGISLKEIRISNYRSFEFASLILENNSVLIGANNAGKTTLLEAIKLAFTNGNKINKEDIHVQQGEILSQEKVAFIDVFIEPTDINEDGIKEFNDSWFELIGDLRSEDLDMNQFFAFRTTVKYNKMKMDYEIERKVFNEWPKVENLTGFTNFKNKNVNSNILQSMPVYYLDAKRDITLEMKSKSSYWGQLVKDVGISMEDRTTIETTIEEINGNIIEKSSVLQHLKMRLESINNTLASRNAEVNIEPISGRVEDLNRGMEIKLKDFNSEPFSISIHGMGTRSWITFLTLVAYIEWKIQKMDEEEIPFHPIILLEEPEAHLHPQAQRKIFNQIKDLQGQKLVSTHSPIIVAQVELKDIIHISKKQNSSAINKIDIYSLEEQDGIRKVKQEVLNTRGDLLFAKAIILCEGETEEQALPKFFKKYFSYEPFELGINIVSVGGSGKYSPFLRIAKDLNIECFILSDGEQETIKKVKKDFKKVWGEDNLEEIISSYVKFLPNGNDFEGYLIEEDYILEIEQAINCLRGEGYVEGYIDKKNGTTKKRIVTDEICDKCSQNIYQSLVRDYTGDIGYREAMLDCIRDMKTAYSYIIADIIMDSNIEQPGRQIPNVISDLFELLSSKLN